MTHVWIVLIQDRHTDTDALPFSSQDRAVTAARDAAAANSAYLHGEVREAALTPGMIASGWVLLLEYGTEGDRVRVLKRTVDGGGV